MEHGFVYILGNHAMPGRYKVGSTSRSPFLRADELGRATGVPMNFTVLGFAAFRNASEVEAELHERFSASRCDGKEFFSCRLRELWGALAENDDRLCLCDVEAAVWIYEEEHPL